MLRVAARIFDREILILHLHAYLQPFLVEQNGHGGALSESPFPAAIAGVLFFEEPVHRPFDPFTEILREKETKFVSIRDFGRALFFFLLAFRRRRAFFVANSADTKLIFGKQGWI